LFCVNKYVKENSMNLKILVMEYAKITLVTDRTSINLDTSV